MKGILRSLRSPAGGLCLLLSLGASGARAADLSTPLQPNIIVIYADDLGYGDLGCYGAKAVATPNVDSLAAGGIRFTSAYATASTCTPSRYSLLTGQYAFRNREAVILPGNAPLIISPATPTIASLLKSRGYATGLVGKWHLGLGSPTTPLDWNGLIAPGPHELGFDYSFHMAATGDRVPAVFIENGRVVNLDPADPLEVSYKGPIGNEPTGLSHPELLKFPADEQHAKTIVGGISRIGYMAGGTAAHWDDATMPDTFLAHALQFIKSHRGEPFFLYYATHEVHVPRWPHPRFRGATKLGVRGDAIVQMDWSVGQIVAALRDLGLTEKTLIVFSSDNGPVLNDGYTDQAAELNGSHRPAGPWRGGKYSAWEGGTRMPFIVSWPGTVKPGLSAALVSQVDLLASLAALTGATVPSGQATDSQNRLAVLLGRTGTGRDHVIEQGVHIEAVRQGDWKYLPPGRVRSRDLDGKVRQDVIPAGGALFFLPEDPAEEHNLAARFPEKAAALHALLQSETGDHPGKPQAGQAGGSAAG